MGAVLRVIVGAFMMFATFVLGLVIDTAGGTLLEINRDMGVDEGPFAPVVTMADGIIWLIVPLLLLGIVLWMIWGVVQEERREEQIRRVP